MKENKLDNKPKQGNQKNQGSDNMKGWERKKLGEISDIINGGTPDTTVPKFWDGENLWITPKDMGKLESIYVDDTLRKLTDEGLNNSSAKILPPNSIILSSRAPIGHLAINTKPISTNQGCKGLVPKKGVDTLFLYYFLSKSVDLLNSLGTGATFKELSGSKLGTVEIPLPPLPEQQRIVSILDECFSAIERSRNNAEQNLKNAKEVFESYLQGVFGGSTGSPTKRDGWEEKRLGELATFRNGMNFTKSSKGEKINIVGVKDFQNSFWVPFETLETVTLEGNLNDLDLLQEGDIIVVRSNGNPQLIGRTLLASEVNGKVSHSGFTIRIRLNTKNIDPIYLCNYLKISSTRRILVDRGNGVGIKSLNQGSLSTLIIPYPKTLKEQQTIVLQLDALRAETQKLEAVYQKKLDDLEELKKSVLKRAFAGEL